MFRDQGTSFAPADRNVGWRGNSLRCYGAEESSAARLAINIWLRCGPAYSATYSANFRNGDTSKAEA